jgi:hypothetical protein
MLAKNAKVVGEYLKKSLTYLMIQSGLLELAYLNLIHFGRGVEGAR